MNAGGNCVMFAPVLKSEGWLSIDLQQADILRALGATRPDLPVVVLKPGERLSLLPFGRRFSREEAARLRQCPALQLDRLRGKTPRDLR